MSREEMLPERAWRWLGLSAAFTLIAIVTMIGLISSGVFDPKPIGQLKESYDLGEIVLPSQSQSIVWHDEPQPAGRFTLRLTASRKDGEIDSGYGLVIGESEDFVGVAVSPVGYLTIWRGGSELDQTNVQETLLPWQTWPHVRIGEDSNEIWLDVEEGHITSIRINRELLWQGKIPVQGRKVATWAQSFGEPVTIQFPKLEHFTQQVE